MLKKNKKLLIFIIIGFSIFLTIIFICFFWNLFNNLGIFDIVLKPGVAHNINTNNKKINILTETLNEKEYVLASDFFEFEFSKGYLLCDRYIGGEALSKDYGWDVKESEVPYQYSDYISRIVFVDKNDKFIYLFNYTVDEGKAKSYFINMGVIIYPDTKIIKYKVRDDGFTVLKFESDDYYDEKCKSLTE